MHDWHLFICFDRAIRVYWHVHGQQRALTLSGAFVPSWLGEQVYHECNTGTDRDWLHRSTAGGRPSITHPYLLLRASNMHTSTTELHVVLNTPSSRVRATCIPFNPKRPVFAVHLKSAELARFPSHHPIVPSSSLTVLAPSRSR